MMKKQFEPLFEPLELPNGVKLKNRFVLAPLTHSSSNDDGTTSTAELEHFDKRSKDVGLALTAASNVTDLGKAFPGQPSIAHDSDLDGLKQLATTMKQNGAKAVVQIHHGGAQSLPYLTPGGDVAGPSPITMQSFDESEPHDAREITQTEIAETITAFGEATKRAIDAGFDGVEIHGANHYLIHQFVSPHYNKRTDEWGKDRLKFPLAVIDEVLKVVKAYGNDDFIVGYRLSPEDPEEDGLKMELTETLVKTIIEKPLDYLHVSLMHVFADIKEGKYKGQEKVALLHEWIGGRMPLIGIGSVFTAGEALEAINSPNVDLIAIGRGILLDYNFISKIKSGNEDEIISEFDPNRTDKHHLPPKLWEQLNAQFYPLPRVDK